MGKFEWLTQFFFSFDLDSRYLYKSFSFSVKFETVLDVFSKASESTKGLTDSKYKAKEFSKDGSGKGGKFSSEEKVVSLILPKGAAKLNDAAQWVTQTSLQPNNRHSLFYLGREWIYGRKTLLFLDTKRTFKKGDVFLKFDINGDLLGIINTFWHISPLSKFSLKIHPKKWDFIKNC